MTALVILVTVIRAFIFFQQRFQQEQFKSAFWFISSLIFIPCLILLLHDVLTLVFSLSHELKPTVNYMLTVEPVRPDRWQLLKVPQGCSDVFLFRPFEQLRQSISQKFRLSPLSRDMLWKVTI